MQIIRWISLLAVLAGPVKAAGTYTDPATSQFFKNLRAPTNSNCCDQADCHVAASDYRIDADGIGSWWAKSNQTGEWVRIEPGKITTDDSVFPQAILCEAPPRLSDGLAIIFCFARPPSGF